MKPQKLKGYPPYCIQDEKLKKVLMNVEINMQIPNNQRVNSSQFQCFSNDHPIVKCNKFEIYPVSELFKFDNLDEREKYLKRCIAYELDPNRKKELQIFDMPLNVHTTATGNRISNKTILISTKHKKIQLSYTIYLLRSSITFSYKKWLLNSLFCSFLCS